LQRLQAEARAAGEPIPARLPPATPVFDVPYKLSKILNRDLVMAGLARRVKVDGKWRIEKRDERGRTIDVHALRHTFGTMLSRGGVAPRTAQAAMRHSKIELTMNVYTDPKLLDVRGALDTLPELPLDGERRQVAATGTDAPQRGGCKPLAPALAPTLDKSVQARRHSLSVMEWIAVRGRKGGRLPQVPPLSKESTRWQRLSAGVIQWALQDLNL
jgi:hypothetical protein